MASDGNFGEQKVNGRCPTMNETKAERLEMRWLPVIDASGRTRMEATWVVVPSAAAAAQEQAATHAA
jgi:hypothetical protein